MPARGLRRDLEVATLKTRLARMRTPSEGMRFNSDAPFNELTPVVSGVRLERFRVGATARKRLYAATKMIWQYGSSLGFNLQRLNAVPEGVKHLHESEATSRRQRARERSETHRKRRHPNVFVEDGSFGHSTLGVRPSLGPLIVSIAAGQRWPTLRRSRGAPATAPEKRQAIGRRSAKAASQPSQPFL